MKYILPKPHIHLKFSQPIVSSCLRLTVSSCLPDSHGPILACRSNTPPVRRPSYCSPHRLRRFARVFLLLVLSPAATKPAAEMTTRGRRWQACQALICAATKPAAKMTTRGRRWQDCQALICAATKPAAKMNTRGAIGDKACTKRMHGIELRSRDEFAIGEVGHHLVGEAFQRGPDTVGCERSEVCQDHQVVHADGFQFTDTSGHLLGVTK